MLGLPEASLSKKGFPEARPTSSPMSGGKADIPIAKGCLSFRILLYSIFLLFILSKKEKKELHFIFTPVVAFVCSFLGDTCLRWTFPFASIVLTFKVIWAKGRKEAGSMLKKVLGQNLHHHWSSGLSKVGPWLTLCDFPFIVGFYNSFFVCLTNSRIFVTFIISDYPIFFVLFKWPIIPFSRATISNGSICKWLAALNILAWHG